jgi:hypothetical protein
MVDGNDLDCVAVEAVDDQIGGRPNRKLPCSRYLPRSPDIAESLKQLYSSCDPSSYACRIAAFELREPNIDALKV